MALGTVLASYRPSPASTGNSSQALSSQTIVSSALYARFVVAGTQTATTRVCAINSDANTGDLISLNLLTIGPDTFRADTKQSGASYGAGVPAGTIAAGDLVELIATLDTVAKTIVTTQSINGATSTVGSSAAITTIGTTWGGGSGLLQVNRLSNVSALGAQSIQGLCFTNDATATLADFRAWYGIADDDMGWQPSAAPQDLSVVSVW